MNSTIEKNSGLILWESVCIERAKSLINHPDLIETDIKLLKSYLKNYNKVLKKFMVSYSKKGVVLDEDMQRNLYHYKILVKK